MGIYRIQEDYGSLAIVAIGIASANDTWIHLSTKFDISEKPAVYSPNLHLSTLEVIEYCTSDDVCEFTQDDTGVVVCVKLQQYGGYQVQNPHGLVPLSGFVVLCDATTMDRED